MRIHGVQRVLLLGVVDAIRVSASHDAIVVWREWHRDVKSIYTVSISRILKYVDIHGTFGGPSHPS